MKVHLRQIPSEGLHIEGEDPSSILELEEPEVVPKTPVSYSLDLLLGSDGLLATGQLSVDCECTCVTCLEKFMVPVRVEDFACQVELTGTEEIDLTPVVREDIILTLPPHPHCDWSGERQCPGVPRPQTAASSEASEVSSEAWGALDQLKIK
jgi:uncharacterized metal-binding protein YceD (DUF177 family)